MHRTSFEDCEHPTAEARRQESLQSGALHRRNGPTHIEKSEESTCFVGSHRVGRLTHRALELVIGFIRSVESRRNRTSEQRGGILSLNRVFELEPAVCGVQLPEAFIGSGPRHSEGNKPRPLSPPRQGTASSAFPQLACADALWRESCGGQADTDHPDRARRFWGPARSRTSRHAVRSTLAARVRPPEPGFETECVNTALRGDLVRDQRFFRCRSNQSISAFVASSRAWL